MPSPPGSNLSIAHSRGHGNHTDTDVVILIWHAGVGTATGEAMSSTIYFPGADFVDVCAHPTEQFAVTYQSGKTLICRSATRELWRVELPVKGLYLRTACDPDGGVLALMQGDFPQGDLLAVYHGNPPVLVCPTYGQNVCVLDYFVSAFTAFVQIGPTTARRMRFRGATWDETSTFIIPATSQGFLDIRAGEPILTDGNRLRSIRGQRVALPNDEGRMCVGQWVDKPGMAAILLDEPVSFTAMPGLVYEPHVAAVNGGFVVCGRTERDGAAYRVLSPPWPVDPPEPVTVAPFEKPLFCGPILSDGTEPGNCHLVKVDAGTPQQLTLLIDRAKGQAVGAYIEGGDAETLAQRVRELKTRTDLPIIAGADGNFFPLTIAGATWVGWEVYPRTPTESAAVVEARIRSALQLAVVMPRMLIACCYTLSGWYQGEVLPLLQAAERLSRDPSVFGYLYFSGKGRSGGIGDRPELVPYLDALVQAIPGTPQPESVPPIVIPPKEPDVSQPYPDEQTWWKERRAEAVKLYTDPPPDGAGKPLDDDYPLIPFARVGYDIGAGMTKEQSWKKHRAELRAALGLPAENPL